MSSREDATNLDNPLVSIIIPSYNSRKWVCDAIDCALQQTYPHCEVIVIDDGSTDGTSALLEEKYGCSIRYFYQKNSGLAAARNAGISYAIGKYIQFLDADDLIASNKLQVQVESLAGYDRPALSYCDYVCSDLTTNQLLDKKMSPVIKHENQLHDLALRWECDLSIPAHCFLFEAKLFTDHQILFDTSLPNHEDWDCWMQIFALYPQIVFIDDVLAFYRQNADSMCKNQQKMRAGFLMAVTKQKRIFMDDPEMLQILRMKKENVRALYHEYGIAGRIKSHLPKLLVTLGRVVIPERVIRFFY